MSAGRSFFLSSIDGVMSWARSRSLWYVSTGTTCCADELSAVMGCRYDIERFGAIRQADPRQADLLVITGAVSYKAAPVLRAAFEEMARPRYVLALGACACGGGAFAPEYSYSVVPGSGLVVPVDVYVPGCPPRPEAIMDGLIQLQEKIRGRQAPSETHP